MLLLDVTMPMKNGFEVLKGLKPLFPSLPVLILSMHSSEKYADKVVKAGASGYLTKEDAPDHLVSTIRRIVYGVNSFSPPDMVH